jgi:prepilin peptidase CpaA
MRLVLAYIVIGILASLLFVAAWYDLKYKRIPNRLVATGLVLGVLANGLLPEGYGFASKLPGAGGWLYAIQGAGVGLLLLLPFYLLRAMGAGDVKLVAMVGAFLGPASVVGTVLFTFLAGGLMSLYMLLRAGMLGRLLHNFRLMFAGVMSRLVSRQSSVMEDLPESVVKLPYALAITAGTLSYTALRLMT